MENNYNTPQFNPERTPQQMPVTPEFRPGATPEREQQPGGPERGVEQGPQVPAATPPIPVALPQVPVPNPQPQVDDSTIITDVPDVAADEDRIEREWVDKAKKIIADTHGDPYKREQAIGQLQREYLLKRYGKEIGASN